MAENSPEDRLLDEADSGDARAISILFNSPIDSGQRIAWIKRRVAGLQVSLTPKLVGWASKGLWDSSLRGKAEDLVADVWFELLKNLRCNDERAEHLFSCLPRESAIEPFLFKLTHRRRVDLLRKFYRDKEDNIEDEDTVVSGPIALGGGHQPLDPTKSIALVWEKVLLLIQDPSSASNWRSSLAIHQFVVFFGVRAGGIRPIDIARDLSSTLGQLLEVPSKQSNEDPHSAMLIQQVRSVLQRRMLSKYSEGVLWKDVRMRELLDHKREARTQRRKTPEEDYAKIIDDWISSITRRLRQMISDKEFEKTESARRERCLHHMEARFREEEATAPGLLLWALIMVNRYKPFEGRSTIAKVLGAVSELSMEEAFSILKGTAGSFPNFSWSDSLATYLRTDGSEPLWKSSMRALAANVDSWVELQPERLRAGLSRMAEYRKGSPGKHPPEAQSILLWALIMVASDEHFERFWSVPSAFESVGNLDHQTAMSRVNEYIARNYRDFVWPATISVKSLTGNTETIRAASVRLVFEKEHNVFRGRDTRKYGGQSK